MLVASALRDLQAFGIATAIGDTVKLVVLTSDGQTFISNPVKVDGTVIILAISVVDGLEFENFCVVFGTNTNMYIFRTSGGFITENQLQRGNFCTTGPCLSISECFFASSLYFICCSDEGVYLSEKVVGSQSLTFLKTKMIFNSEIGPQNKLLLSKSKFTSKRAFTIVKSSPELLLVSESSSTGLCQMHWGTADTASNTITVSWSMSFAVDPPILPSKGQTAVHPEFCNSVVELWTCIVVGSELWIISAKGLLGKINLSLLPRVSALIMRSIVFADSPAKSSLGTVLLSCVGGDIYELVIDVSETSCDAQYISQKRMHSIYGGDQTRARQVPSCDNLTVIPCWFPGAIVKAAPLILLCQSSSLGSEVLVDEVARELLADGNDLWNFLHSLNSVSGINCAIYSRGDCVLASHFCPATNLSAVSRLSLSPARLRCFEKHCLDLEEAEVVDVSVLTAQVVGTKDPAMCQLIVLTSRSATQSAFYWRCSDEQSSTMVCGSQPLVPWDSDMLLTSERTIGLFAVHNHSLVVQVTGTCIAVCSSQVGSSITSSVQGIADLIRQVQGNIARLLVEFDEYGQVVHSPLSSSSFFNEMQSIHFAGQVGNSIFLAHERVVLLLSVSVQNSAVMLAIARVYVLPAPVRCFCCCTDAAGGGAGVLAVAYWGLSSVHLISVSESFGSTSSDISAPSAVRITSLNPCKNSSDSVAKMGVCAISGTSVVAFTVLTLSSPSGLTVTHIEPSSHTQGRASNLVGSRELTLDCSMITSVVPAGNGFLLRGLEDQFFVGRNSEETLDWSVSTLQAPSKMRVQTMFALCNTSSGDRAIVGWVERGADEGVSDSSICFGEVCQNQSTALLISRAHVSGKISSMELSAADETKLVVLIDTTCSEKTAKLGSPAVSQGAVAVYDTRTLQCLWELPLLGDAYDPTFLVAAVAGPKPVGRNASHLSKERHCVSLLRVSTSSTACCNAPSGSVTVMALSVPLQSATHGDGAAAESSAAAAPLGVVEVAWDNIAPTVSSSGSSSDAAPVAALCKKSVHCKCLGEDILVLCLPDNTLRLVGWAQQQCVGDSSSSGGEDFSTSLQMQLVEHSRASLQDKVARVVGVAVVSGSTSSRGGDGGGRVVVSLALCGIEIYSLCRRAQGAPLLQVSFVINNTAAIWNNLALCECVRHGGDAELTIVARNRVTDEAQTMRINIYSDLNALQGKVPTCVVQPVNLPGGVHIESVAQFLPAQSMQPGFSLTLLRNGEFFLLRSDFNEV